MLVEDQGEVIAFLSAPATYGPAAGEVERIETHSAVVFLAGARAYKLKRAVRYDYLDFSSLELRRAACDAEVRLNRRAAPTLYLGILPITRETDGVLALGGRGDPVEWVVEMVRFDQDRLFDRLAARRTLALGLMAGLAAAVARLHAVAERRHDHGGHAGMRWVIDGNAAGFAEQGRDILDPRACARLTGLARAAIERHAGLLEARRRDGFVRWCHGDLHLRNIVLLDSEPTLFDAVEFNAEIACTDVLYDLAFLLMDLWRRDLTGHASAVFNEYLAITRDTPGLPLLALFLSCRAAIRAKTNATAARLQSDARRAAPLEEAARTYLAMATELLQPPPARLVAVGGRSGTGKSTLARRFAPRVGAVPGALVLRSDLIRKALVGKGALERLGSEAYTPEVTRRVYEKLCQDAVAAARAGQAVIVDAVFGSPAQRAAIAEAARRAALPFTGFWLEAPPDVLAHRIRGRAADASDATVDVLRQQLGRDPGPVTWFRIDVSGDEAAVQRRAEKILAGAP